jgi:predicted RNase H-like nuclease (RuvC/YqgF family)
MAEFNERQLEQLQALFKTLQTTLETTLQTTLEPIRQDIAELKTDVAKLKTDVAELKTDVAELKTDVAELKTDVAELKTDVAELKTDVAKLKENLSFLAKCTETEREIAKLKSQNSKKKRTQKPAVIPRLNPFTGESDYPHDIAYPIACGDIITAGNEVSGGSSVKNAWSADKSFKLIKFYDEDYESESEGKVTSRRRRIVLAQHLGFSADQLNGFEAVLSWE